MLYIIAGEGAGRGPSAQKPCAARGCAASSLGRGAGEAGAYGNGMWLYGTKIGQKAQLWQSCLEEGECVQRRAVTGITTPGRKIILTIAK